MTFRSRRWVRQGSRVKGRRRERLNCPRPERTDLPADPEQKALGSPLGTFGHLRRVSALSASSRSLGWLFTYPGRFLRPFGGPARGQKSAPHPCRRSFSVWPLTRSFNPSGTPGLPQLGGARTWREGGAPAGNGSPRPPRPPRARARALPRRGPGLGPPSRAPSAAA